MKITDVNAYIVDSGLSSRSRCWVFVEITTSEGTVGIGEACNWPGDLTIEAGIRELKRILVGEDPMNVEKLWAKMYRGTSPHGLSGVITTSMSGIDQALWDIRGKILGAPVWQLLGGACRRKVRVYSHAYGATPEELAENALSVISEGFSAVKFDPFQTDPYTYSSSLTDVKLAIEKVKAVREAVGWNVEILIEAHGKFNAHTAIKVGKKLERYEPYFFEEPVPPENVDAMAKVSQHLDIPIATGEHLYTKFGFRSLLEKEAVDIIQPDIARAGGITELKKIAAMAEAYYVPLAPHNPNGPLANYANIHLLAAIPNCAILEWVRNNPAWTHEVVTPPLIPKDGFVEVPNRPGLGAEINKKIVMDHLFDEKRYLPT